MKTKVNTPDKTSGSPFRSRGRDPLAVQAKLFVNQPGDQHEAEADKAADSVVNGSKPTGTNAVESSAPVQLKPIAQTLTPTVQRKENPDQMGQLDVDGTEDKMGAINYKGPVIQRKEEDQPVNDLFNPNENQEGKTSEEIPIGDQIQGTKGQGSPLPSDINTEMNTGFGADFSNVKIHTGTQAEEMNSSLQSQAFTNQNDIYFNTNKFDPSTTPGKFLLAHELTHTIQQGAVLPAKQPGKDENPGLDKSGNIDKLVPDQLTKPKESSETNTSGIETSTTEIVPKESAKLEETPIGNTTKTLEPDTKKEIQPTTPVDNSSVKEPVTNNNESGNLTETKNSEQNDQSKEADNSGTNQENFIKDIPNTGETKNTGDVQNTSVLPAATNTENGTTKQNNTNETQATDQEGNLDEVNTEKSGKANKNDQANLQTEQPPGDQQVNEPALSGKQETIDIASEISAFKQRTSWYKSNAAAMINGHITEIKGDANQQVEKINTSAANNSKWIANSYDTTLLNIEKQRKETIREILESKNKEKAAIRQDKYDQLKALETGTQKRVRTLRSDGEKIAQSAKDNGKAQKKRILDYRTNADKKLHDYILERIKIHNVPERTDRMLFRLSGIKAGGMEQILEITDELLEKVEEQTSELVERIREEYTAAADTLPEEKETIRQAIIDAADAALESIDLIDIDSVIQQLNDNIQKLREKTLQDKADILQSIEDARKQSILEIRNEENTRIADYKKQLADYIEGVDQVRQEVKTEIADKPDTLAKELLDLTIKKLDGAHHHLRVDTKNGKNKLLAAFKEASHRTIVFFYNSKTKVFDHNKNTLSEVTTNLPQFAKKAKTEYQRISKEASTRMTRAVTDYMTQLDKAVRDTISVLTKEKRSAVNELNASVDEVLKETNQIITETLVAIFVEARQLATEWNATYYTRITLETIGDVLLVLLEIAAWIIAIVVAIVLLIILIVVLIVTGVIDAIILAVTTIVRFLVPQFVRWLARAFVQFIRPFLTRLFQRLVQLFAKQFFKWLGKWILRALLAWGLYEGFKLIWTGIVSQHLSRSERRQMMFDGFVLVGTSIITEWKLIKTIFRGRVSYKSFQALSKLIGDAKVAKDLVNIAKGDILLATRIAKIMDPNDLRLIIGYVDDAVDLEKALALSGNNGRALLDLITHVDDFKQLVVLLEKSGGNAAMLNRILPRVNSADELVILFDRVGNPAKVEKLLDISTDINQISDDALNSMLKMSDDELKAFEGKTVDEIEKDISKVLANSTFPESWSKFSGKHNTEFANRLKSFRGSDDLTFDSKFRGGEGQIFTSELEHNLALKRWFENRIGDMGESIRLLKDARNAVNGNSKISKLVDVVTVNEKGSDWILRGFDPRSIPIKKAISDPMVKAKYEKVLNLLSSEKNETLKLVLKKFEKTSANIHWSPVQEKFLIIDML